MSISEKPKTLNARPMSNEAFSRRCEKLFGRYWIQEVAFNLNRSRQSVGLIANGKRRVSKEIAIIVREWEAGRLPMKRRAPIHIGRPRKPAPRKSP